MNDATIIPVPPVDLPRPAAVEATDTGILASPAEDTDAPPAGPTEGLDGAAVVPPAEAAPVDRDGASLMALDAMDAEFSEVARTYDEAAASEVRDRVGGTAVGFDANVQDVATRHGIPASTLRSLRASFLRERSRAEKEIAKAEQAEAGGADSGAGSAVLLPDREPWPVPVDGFGLVNDTAAFIEQHVMVAPGAAIAAALWVVQTYPMFSTFYGVYRNESEKSLIYTRASLELVM